METRVEETCKCNSLRKQGYFVPHSATLQVKVLARSPFGNQLIWFRETFSQIKSLAPKIIGTMATKMVATWRVAEVRFNPFDPRNYYS